MKHEALLKGYQEQLDQAIDRAKKYLNLSQEATIPGMKECHESTADGFQSLAHIIKRRMDRIIDNEIK